MLLVNYFNQYILRVRMNKLKHYNQYIIYNIRCKKQPTINFHNILDDLKIQVRLDMSMFDFQANNTHFDYYYEDETSQWKLHLHH